MKRFSLYFYTLMVIALLLFGFAGFTLAIGYPTLSAILSMCSFTTWFAGIMAPNYQKYKKYDGNNSSNN